MKKILDLFIIITFIYISLQFILLNETIKETIIFSYTIFFENVFPNLFPFLVISNLLINYGFIDICYKLFNNIMTKIFKISGNSSFVFFMSIITGFPSNAKYTKELLESNKIDFLEATKILMFTHFPNPLFIIGMISTFFDKKTAILVLLCIYIGNLTIGILFRNKYVVINNIRNISTKYKESFGICFSKSIKNSIDTLLLIFGTMTSFLILTCIIQSKINFSDINHTLISGFLEFTQGLKYASLLEISNRFKVTFMTMFIAFGGISVHMQILSIISNTKIKYVPFLISRFIHMIISGTLIFILI